MTSTNDKQVMPSRYKMDQKERGIALIINIYKYDDPNPFELEERKWSHSDVESLTKTLQYLEFDVELGQNLTKSEIEERLREIAEVFIHRHYDCFLCVVMSHGNEDKIVTRDSKKMSFEEIMAPIKACSSLLKKPKMFFFQACRGKKEMETTQMNSNAMSSASSIQTSMFPKVLKILQPIETDSVTFNDAEKVATNFDEESDLLVFYSTLPDHYSYAYSHNVADGTTFIQSFCQVFNDAYKNLPNNLSLTQMILRINEKVSNKRMQISVPELRMTKEIYFWPKDVSNLIIF